MGCLGHSTNSPIFVAKDLISAPLTIRRISNPFLYQLMATSLNAAQQNLQTLEVLDFRNKGDRLLGYYQNASKVEEFIGKLDSFKAKIIYNFKHIIAVFDTCDQTSQQRISAVAHLIKEKATPQNIILVTGKQLTHFFTLFPAFKEQRKPNAILDNLIANQSLYKGLKFEKFQFPPLIFDGSQLIEHDITKISVFMQLRSEFQLNKERNLDSLYSQLLNITDIFNVGKIKKGVCLPAQAGPGQPSDWMKGKKLVICDSVMEIRQMARSLFQYSEQKYSTNSEIHYQLISMRVNCLKGDEEMLRKQEKQDKPQKRKTKEQQSQTKPATPQNKQLLRFKELWKDYAKESKSKEMQQRALQLTRKLLSNIYDNPQGDSFRKIKKTNKVINDVFINNTHGLLLLQELGFKDLGGDLINKEESGWLRLLSSQSQAAFYEINPNQ